MRQFWLTSRIRFKVLRKAMTKKEMIFLACKMYFPQSAFPFEGETCDIFCSYYA